MFLNQAKEKLLHKSLVLPIKTIILLNRQESSPKLRKETRKILNFVQNQIYKRKKWSEQVDILWTVHLNQQIW